MTEKTITLRTIAASSTALGILVCVYDAIITVLSGASDTRLIFVAMSGIAAIFYGFLILRALNENAGLYSLKKKASSSWIIPVCMLVGTFTVPDEGAALFVIPIAILLVAAVVLDVYLRKAA